MFLKRFAGIYVTGKPVISNLFKGAVTGRPYNKRRRSGVSRRTSSLRLGFDLTRRTLGDNAFRSKRISPEWTATIYDSNFVIVARNRFPEKFVGMPGNQTVVNFQAATNEGAIDIPNKEGNPILAVFSQSKATGWTVVIGIPKAVFVADIWRSLKWAVCGIVLLSITGIGLALLFASDESPDRSMR